MTYRNILLFKEAIKTKEKESIELVLKLCKIESYYIKGKILFLLLTFLKMIQLSEHNTTDSDYDSLSKKLQPTKVEFLKSIFDLNPTSEMMLT